MQPTPNTVPLAIFRRLFLNSAIALALFGAVVAFVLPTKWVSDAMFAVSAALSVASVALVFFVGRVPVLPAGMPADQARDAALKAFRTGIFVRFAVVEGAALFGMVVSFMLDSTVPYFVSGAVAIVLMLVVVRPSEATIRAAEARLDSGGAVSGLSDTFGLNRG
jgi:F0F1-type ATP synthase membrane subunit c/vacuolar-type H+-ATPase subunit K